MARFLAAEELRQIEMEEASNLAALQPQQIRPASVALSKANGAGNAHSQIVHSKNRRKGFLLKTLFGKTSSKLCPFDNGTRA